MKDVMLQTAKILLLGLFVILVWGIFHGSRRRVDFAVLRSEVQEVFGTSGMKEGDAQLLRRLYGEMCIRDRSGTEKSQERGGEPDAGSGKYSAGAWKPAGQ